MLVDVAGVNGWVKLLPVVLLQVTSLMWIRTIMNRQYRYGGTFANSAKELWAEGGIPRFYRGT